MTQCAIWQAATAPATAGASAERCKGRGAGGTLAPQYSQQKTKPIQRTVNADTYMSSNAIYLHRYYLHTFYIHMALGSELTLNNRLSTFLYSV